jgi:hypothetical protein
MWAACVREIVSEGAPKVIYTVQELPHKSASLNPKREYQVFLHFAKLNFVHNIMRKSRKRDKCKIKLHEKAKFINGEAELKSENPFS